jgi:trans-aconitate methyltransferase
MGAEEDVKPPPDLLRRWTPEAPNHRALVLGAGEGDEACWLASQGFRVEAVEKDPARSAALFETCAGTTVTVRQADIERFEISPGGFGLIVALAVLHFVPPQVLPQVAARITGGLVPGGLLLAQVLTSEDPSAQARRARGDEEPLPHTFVLDGGESVIHYFARGQLLAAFSTLRREEHEFYRFVAAGRPEGFGAGEILVGRRPAEDDI